ncbi:unnamed protein product, partial [Ectocarpus sp. 12 AP-2014]
HSGLSPKLRVETAGLEPPASSSAAPRITTPPPTRRLSSGRNSPGTPNPFGGRRRSLDTSPDGARSSPRASGVSPAVLGSSPVSQDGDQNRGRGTSECAAAAARTASALVSAATATAVGSVGKDGGDHVTATHAVKRSSSDRDCDVVGGSNSSSSSSQG